VLPNGPVSQNTLRAHSRRRVAEEKRRATKDVAEVVEVVEAAGITRQVVRLRPFAVIKG
jgi:RNA-splicing ligase RtcB